MNKVWHIVIFLLFRKRILFSRYVRFFSSLLTMFCHPTIPNFYMNRYTTKKYTFLFLLQLTKWSFNFTIIHFSFHVKLTFAFLTYFLQHNYRDLVIMNSTGKSSRTVGSGFIRMYHGVCPEVI